METNTLNFFKAQNIKKRWEDYQLRLEENKKSLFYLGIDLLRLEIYLLKFDLFCYETTSNWKLSANSLKSAKRTVLKHQEYLKGYYFSLIQKDSDAAQKSAEMTAELKQVIAEYEDTLQITGSRDDQRKNTSKKIPLSQDMKDFLAGLIRISKEDIALIEADIDQFKDRSDALALEFLDDCKQEIKEIRAEIESKELLINNGYYNNREDNEETISPVMKR